MKIYRILISAILLAGLTSCGDDWDNHYNESSIVSDKTEVYQGDIVSFVKSQSNLKKINSIFEANNSYSNISTDKGYTFIVFSDDKTDNVTINNEAALAEYCICDLSVAPSLLTEGFGIKTRRGKNVWVTSNGYETFIENFKIERQVKTKNGYVYFLEGIPSLKPSVYEYLQSLGDDYSTFKSFVKYFEEEFFDRENSIPTGVDEMGNTIYQDSIIQTRNTLMDRYTEDGLPMWDMRSEDYLTTMFIPSNDLIEKAITTAKDSIPVWLGRTVTEDDDVKFMEWIVKACFVNERLNNMDVLPGNDIDCVAGFKRVISEVTDSERFDYMDPALWRTAVQKVNAAEEIQLSNGSAYMVTDFKIPNHVVIYRVKAKFYQLWGAMTDAQKNQYFRWDNWVAPLIVEEAQGSFTLTESLPTMYYNVLTAIPSNEAIKDSLPCSVTYDGVLYNDKTGRMTEVHLPAGEYNLRMGFKHSLTYSLSIAFNEKSLVEDMVMYAQGSNFHFDRGSVSTMDYYGNVAIGFGEGFNWKDWIEKDEKAVAYDTDGYQVAIVDLPKSGNFTITITSNDMSYIYRDSGRNKNNVTQLMMYHWCLRPTKNNY